MKLSLSANISKLRKEHSLTQEQLEDITRIVVTHLLEEELRKQYDDIITLKNGSIVETGTFEQLMAEKGYFYSLFMVSQ